METKEELLLYKSALEKLLSNIGLIGPNRPFSCLCTLGGYCLTTCENRVFYPQIKKYAKSIGRDKCVYIWEKRDRQSREEWLEQELEKVNQKLKEYED